MSTITTEQKQAIAIYLDSHHIPEGLGTEEEACSIAAINLALTGELTDGVPDCMSTVIGRWIISVQDAMPDGMRNSPGWKNLLPEAAGTGREHEKERLNIIVSWMWETVLSELVPVAEKHGFKNEWLKMLEERTSDAAYDAYAAADYANVAAYANVADAANAAAYANVAAYTNAADAAYAAAEAAAYAAADADAAWAKFSPIGVLEELIDIN